MTDTWCHDQIDHRMVPSIFATVELSRLVVLWPVHFYPRYSSIKRSKLIEDSGISPDFMTITSPLFVPKF